MFFVSSFNQEVRKKVKKANKCIVKNKLIHKGRFFVSHD
jgi:hypothetical protein